VESGRTARLDESAACLAGSREMIQITAQMRVLVTIELRFSEFMASLSVIGIAVFHCRAIAA
jgi:hypothetical protein